MIAPILTGSDQKAPISTAAAPNETAAGNKPQASAVAFASFSDTVKGETYSSVVSKSDAGYEATVSIPPAVTVRGASEQDVERALSQIVDYYA